MYVILCLESSVNRLIWDDAVRVYDKRADMVRSLIVC